MSGRSSMERPRRKRIGVGFEEKFYEVVFFLVKKAAGSSCISAKYKFPAPPAPVNLPRQRRRLFLTVHRRNSLRQSDERMAYIVDADIAATQGGSDRADGSARVRTEEIISFTNY